MDDDTFYYEIERMSRKMDGRYKEAECRRIISV